MLRHTHVCAPMPLTKLRASGRPRLPDLFADSFCGLAHFCGTLCRPAASLREARLAATERKEQIYDSCRRLFIWMIIATVCSSASQTGRPPNQRNPQAKLRLLKPKLLVCQDEVEGVIPRGQARGGRVSASLKMGTPCKNKKAEPRVLRPPIGLVRGKRKVQQKKLPTIWVTCGKLPCCACCACCARVPAATLPKASNDGGHLASPSGGHLALPILITRGQ